MFVLASIGILVSTLFDLNVKLGKVKIGLYWVIPLVIAVILLLAKGVDASAVWAQFTSKDAMNPLKILVLFLSMTGLSVYLDEIGFFRWLANATLKKQAQVRKIVFSALHRHFRSHRFHVKRRYHTHVHAIYLLFCEKLRDRPRAVHRHGIRCGKHLEYAVYNRQSDKYLPCHDIRRRICAISQMMAIPTVFAGLCSLAILYALFAKKLKEPLKPHEQDEKIDDKPCLIIGLVGLFVCTVMLAISSYIGVEMWLVSLVACAGVLLICSIVTLCEKKSLKPIGKTIARLPWQLVPFLLSMFVIVLSLSECGITEKIAASLQK